MVWAGSWFEHCYIRANFSRDNKSYPERKENGPVMHLEHNINNLITLANIVNVHRATQTGSSSVGFKLTLSKFHLVLDKTA